MHSRRGREINGLRIIRIRLTRRARHRHDGIIGKRPPTIDRGPHPRQVRTIHSRLALRHRRN
ncbi:hypothetical protein NK6_1368 [Bradyrhizobium diazoefficiens]|uniref:Uncharacterized protein n=1 Tax=Bradyrhizobium diazoefficiens TaxID=1355477 RepID=A0A0E4BKL7_9BRAD|nr:hypothetical protein NK6_1368 [Bradyrhizobium diazoefficiens]